MIDQKEIMSIIKEEGELFQKGMKDGYNNIKKNIKDNQYKVGYIVGKFERNKKIKKSNELLNKVMTVLDSNIVI